MSGKFGWLAAGLFVLLILACGCGNGAEAAGNPFVPTAGPEGREEGVFGPSDASGEDAVSGTQEGQGTDGSDLPDGEGKETEPTQPVSVWERIPLIPTLIVEAGTEALSAADFFTGPQDVVVSEDGTVHLDGWELSVECDLTPEQLRAAGAEYEVSVTCLGERTTIPVKVVDTTAPVISGVEDITIQIGEAISYKKNVTVTDNADGDVALEVDRGEVDTETAGTYPVRYTATDASGNTTTADASVIVEEIDNLEQEVLRMADEVIAQLVKEGMSSFDVCYKLWNWCRTKITYAYSAGDRTSVWTGAYEGLHDRSGDCFAYYATFSVLLDRVGIENMCVQRVGGTSNHWWNLVNLGDGWYHCDSSPRRVGDPYRCFMQTDAQVQAYTESYPEKPNYYVFDESLYPERATTIVYGDGA